MASSLILSVIAAFLLLSPAAVVHSQTCKSTKFKTPNKSFATCVDLPYLSATLHYTFDAAKSTLSMAFTAPPAKPSGWVAWAINPIDTAMAGSQALFAAKSSYGSVVVSTLDVQSYSSVVPGGPISINVSDLAGESSSSAITLFATWHLPSKTKSVNQVWQVGPAVTNGVPVEHTFAHDNLLAMSKLQLTSSSSPSPSSDKKSPAKAPAAGAPAPGTKAEKATGTAAPTPASGKNAAVGLSGIGGCLAVVIMAVVGLFF